MYKRILMPIDGSPCSDYAIQEGLKLAKGLSAAVTFLHVLDIQLSIYTVSDSLVFDRQLIEEAKNIAQTSLEKAAQQAQAAGVSATTQLVEDGQQTAVACILKAEAEHDLTVMATHGRRGFDRLLLGSVTEGVLRRSSKPHFIIRCPEASSQ
jgi:nucleotide-binding universal stress UspA family protein